jgi:acyl carrier protein
MDKQEILERVKKVTAEVLNVEPDQVNSESSFVNDLGAESTQSVQLVAGFEEEFDIEMEGEAALAVQTVGDAVDFMEPYINRK